jgi:hypothetical protein
MQRVANDMVSCEHDSDHKVKSENYYIVRLELLDDTLDLSEFAKKDIMAKHIMGEAIMCAYVYYNTAYILFSSTDTKLHYLGGSHHELCSHYASNATKFTGSQTRCNIIEFDSRTKILVYFQTKVFENMRASVKYLSNVTIDKKEASTLTQQELIDALEKRTAVKWADTPSSERFGIFYKYHVLANGTRKFSIMSEQFDAKHMDKYHSYLFG